MPIISDNPKELYETLYKELKNKYSPVSVYLRDKSDLSPEEKEVGKAMESFIKLYEETEKDFSVRTGLELTENEVVYDTVSYKSVKDELAFDEKLCVKLEAAVQNIRNALLHSIENRLDDGYDYEKAKLSSSRSEVFTALNASISDRAGAWQNEEIDKVEKRNTENNLEFAHRPEVFVKVKDPKTQEEKTVRAERYVSYKEKFSKEYRFFNRETSFIHYEREQDPDAFTVAPLTLRDILEYHKERKEEADRRREYVKFINNQHQAYAVWKEQMPKEKERFDNLVMSLSEETQKRFNEAMQNYNSVTSLFSGISNWLDQERADYMARKKVLEDANLASAAAYNKYEEAKSPYDAYLKEMEEERQKASDDLEILRNNPILGKEHRTTQEALLTNYNHAEQELGYELGVLEKEIQDALKEQDRARGMLMSVSEKAKQYKEQVLRLKESQSKDNLEAVKNYYKLLFDGEAELSAGLKDQQNELQETIEEHTAVNKLIEEEEVLMVRAEFERTQKNVELAQDKLSLERVQALAKQLSRKEIKELQTFMKAAKQAIANKGVAEAEQREEFANACEAYAQNKKWRIGTDIIYMDVTEAKGLKERIKANEKAVANLTKEYDEKKENYTKLSARLEDIRTTLLEKIDEAEASVNQFTEKLESLQNENRDKAVNDIMSDINQASMEKVNREGQALTEAEEAIEKSFKELDDEIKKKMALREEKLAQLDDIGRKRAEAENALQSADSAREHLEEQQKKFDELVEKQEEKKKQLEEAKEKAYTEWMSKEMDEDNLKKESDAFIKDYELVQQKFDEGEISSIRRMEDLSKLVQTQTEKLSKDAEAQKEYIHKKEDAMCTKFRSQLVPLKVRLLGTAQPQSRFKSSNSREFTELKNVIMMYLEPRLSVADPENPGEMITVDNPNYILDKLETVNEKYKTGDEEREKLMKEVRDAMGKISEVSEKYLQAKGSPHRVTELGRARYALANDVKLFTKNAQMQLSGMLREEEYCRVAPDMDKVSAKSGLTTTFEKTEGYQYTSQSIQREADVFSLDVLMEMKKQDPKVEPQAPIV